MGLAKTTEDDKMTLCASRQVDAVLSMELDLTHENVGE